MRCEVIQAFELYDVYFLCVKHLSQGKILSPLKGVFMLVSLLDPCDTAFHKRTKLLEETLCPDQEKPR